MQRYCWDSLQDDSHHDSCVVDFSDTGLKAVGTQVASAYQASWILDVSEDWITRRIHIEVQGTADWARSLDLLRSSEGEWIAQTTVTGTQIPELPAPGIAAGTDLSQALDIDLGKCPLTNVMPIRRLELQTKTVAQTPFIMAWIDMPSLQIIASDQYYSSLDASHVRYVSGTRGVDVTLSVDEWGVVLDYPGLARNVAAR